MKIRSFEELATATDKVLTNCVSGNAAKTVSLMLEAGKGLEAIMQRHPDAKGINDAFRKAGGVGKAPDLATLTRNVFNGLVQKGHLTESDYDFAVMNHCKVVSPTLNILDKHASVFAGGYDEEFRQEIAGIMSRKPEDGVKLLKDIRRQVEEMAGLKEEKDILTEFREMLASYVTGVTVETKGGGSKFTPAIIGDDLAEGGYELLREFATEMVNRLAGIDAAKAATPAALPTDPTALPKAA